MHLENINLVLGTAFLIIWAVIGRIMMAKPQ